MRRSAMWLAPVVLVAVTIGVIVFFHHDRTSPPVGLTVTYAPEPPEASAASVHTMCAACHAYPEPSTFPRRFWRFELKQAYDFFHESDLPIDFPPFESTVRFYETRAPEKLPLRPPSRMYDSATRHWSKMSFRYPDGGLAPAVTNVNLVHLTDHKKLDVLVCDARRNEVLLLQPYRTTANWHSLAHLPAPAHTQVVDLDGDGIPDILVACLGSFSPTDDRVGSVVWLRGRADGTYQPITLLENVGRVADVEAAAFRGNGKRDLVVGVFGWRHNGEILYLENQTIDWKHPRFMPHLLDDRHGTIHVPVCDLNGDGKLDFVALISQEHETVVAFLNDGKGHFQRQTIYRAPHPAYGSSGIQVVDMNGDGRPDILYSNGDIMDPPPFYKPYHGVQWLENTGKFPFTRHEIAPLYGAMRAVTADLRSKRDVVAVSYLPPEQFPDRDSVRPDAVVWFERTGPDIYARHVLEQISCEHLTCAVGDVLGDGRTCIVSGNHYLDAQHPEAYAVDIWVPPPELRNQSVISDP
jgi:hypothetical protein